MNTGPVTTVLFDLDGTLVDSSRTIATCIDYALRRAGADSACGRPVTDLIGMPLLDIFRNEFGLSDAQTDAAIDYYRDHYDALEQEGTRIYDGVQGLLSGLQESGMRLFVATVKPAPIAEKVLADLELRSFFEGVSGSSMDHRRRTKAGIIAHAVSKWRIDPVSSMMVGDRGQDIHGARENGMRATAVTYGFGSEEELRNARPDHMVNHSRELKLLLIRTGCDRGA